MRAQEEYYAVTEVKVSECHNDYGQECLFYRFKLSVAGTEVKDKYVSFEIPLGDPDSDSIFCIDFRNVEIALQEELGDAWNIPMEDWQSINYTGGTFNF